MIIHKAVDGIAESPLMSAIESFPSITRKMRKQGLGSSGICDGYVMDM